MPGDDAISAWERFRGGADIQQLDSPSHLLLPLVYTNLREHGVVDPEMGRLRGMFRSTWVRNQLLVRQGRELLAKLHEAGVETLLLKGAALIMLDYRSAGMRPMADLDVLVRPEQVEDAVAVLTSLGWASDATVKTPSRLAFLHADTFQNRNRFPCELHWRTIMHREPELDFWQRAVAVDFGGVETRSLCAADRLLHVCVHGLTPADSPPIRWVADALTITERHAIEWPRLVDQARRREVILVNAEALGYLVDTFRANIPAQVLDELGRGPHSRLERRGRRAATGSWGLRDVLPWHWYLCRRVTPSRSRAIVAFPRYLLAVLGYERWRDLARHSVGRLAKGPSLKR
jgi:hypothetical protein